MEDITKVYEGHRVITATELKSNLGKYLDEATQKKETVITKNGERIARLVPYIQDFTGYLLAKEEAVDYQGQKVSYEEFMHISETIEARMEYINGEIILQASPNSFHQDAVGNLYLLLKTFFKGKSCKVFLAPFDVTLYKKEIKTPDVVQPDLLVICDGETKIDDKGRYSGIPTFVIEVLSPSTQSRDMLDKLNTFMRSGVKEYWIIDIHQQKVLQYTFNEYDLMNFSVYSVNESLSSYAFPELSVIVKEIFEE